MSGSSKFALIPSRPEAGTDKQTRYIYYIAVSPPGLPSPAQGHQPAPPDALGLGEGLGIGWQAASRDCLKRRTCIGAVEQIFLAACGQVVDTAGDSHKARSGLGPAGPRCWRHPGGPQCLHGLLPFLDTRAAPSPGVAGIRTQVLR